MKSPKENTTSPLWCKTHAARYAFLGAIFGLIFPAMAITIDFYRIDIEPSLSSIAGIHKNFPIHFIIDTAPFFLGLFAFFGGRAMDKVEVKNTQLTKALKFKDNFLASMSHEIRTPMSGVIGVIDLLSKSKGIGEKDKEYLEIMRTSSNDLMKIINDILDLSKLKAGKLDIHRAPTDIKKIGTDVINLFLAVGLAKNIELRLDIAENVPRFVKIDDIRVKQVLSNFLGNAIKFSTKGTVTLRISYLNDNHNNIKFEVVDQGIGIRDEQLASIFTAYRQLEDYSTKQIKGTGLGLFISKSLIKLMGGEVGVISEYGKGSNFWFTIKASECSNPKESLVDYCSEAVKDENFDFHILMVDDNKTLCALYKRMLEKLGCQIVLAHNGEELIEAFREGLYDIILLDINMPKMGGVEAMKYLKSNFKEVPPIIGASASALKGDIDRYMTLGFDDYITKPFTTDRLKTKLSKWAYVTKKGDTSKKIDDYIIYKKAPL